MTSNENLPVPVIVVLNHSESLLLLIRTMLSKQGYRVVTHLQSLTSVEEIKAERPDLIILGYYQGDVENELDMIHIFREDADLHSVPVLSCTTGLILDERVTLAKAAPYVRLVEKPFSAAALSRAVENILHPPS